MSASGSPRRVIVTGGSGKAGRYVVQEFVAHGYHVLNLDLKPLPALAAPTVITNLTDAGQVFKDGFCNTLTARIRDGIVRRLAVIAIRHEGCTWAEIAVAVGLSHSRSVIRAI